MFELKQAIADVADFPRPGILFRDISPLLRDHFGATVRALDALPRIGALRILDLRGNDIRVSASQLRTRSILF